MWSWTLLAPALAGGLDADGAGLPVHDGAHDSPALLSKAPELGRAGIAIGLRGSLDVAPLVRTEPDASTTDLVGLATVARLQGAVGLAEFLSVAVDAPFRVYGTSDLVAQGPAFGDASATLWARTTVQRVRLGGGLGARLPTGQPGLFAGSGRVIPEVHVTARAGTLWTVSAALDGAFEGSVAPADAIGGAIVGGGVGLDHVRDRWAAGLAVRGSVPLAEDVRIRRGVPLEVGVHGGFAATEHVALDVLGARAILDAAGSPTWRVSAAVVAAFGPRIEPPQPRILTYEITVLDPDGVPVAGAEAAFDDGVVVASDANGTIRWEGKARPVISAPGLQAVQIRDSGEVRLDWAPVELRVVVATEKGEAVTPAIRLEEEGAPPLALADGTWATQVLPGTWTLSVGADGYGSQTREIDVQPGRTEPIAIEVVLLPTRGDARLDVTIADPQGNGVLGAEVRIDGVAIGTAGQGAIGIAGLEETTHEVAVDARYFDEESQEVDLQAGSGRADFGLYYAPGTVRVTALGPHGPIRDGTVFFQGPRALPPLKLGDHGERLVQLSNGRWACVLSSPAYGLQERSLLVEPGGPVPLNAAFRLQAAAEGASDLVVKLTDPDGRPLEDVEIDLDGASVGRTGTGGELRLFDLQTGPVTLRATGEALVTASKTVELREGLQAVGLGLIWDQGAVRVAANTPRGPADAYVEFDGPEPYEGGSLGEPGRRLFQKVPGGEWELVASHQEGMEVAWTLVSDIGGRLTDVSIALGEETGDATLEVVVTDPDGAPVDGVEVLVDGRPLARTASGGRLRVSGLDAGPRELRLVHPTFETWSSGTALTDGEVNTAVVGLVWKPGVLDILVRSGGKPADDAVIYVAGNRSVPPIEPGPDGRAVVPLGPGDWDVLVSSPSGGLAERSVTLAEVGPPTRLEVDLDATSGLVVQVLDRRGEGIADAEVRVDGTLAGTTDTSGTLVVDLPDAGASIAVSHPHLEPVGAVQVPPGTQQQLFEAKWKLQSVPVRIRHQGQAHAAKVGAMGPGRIEPVTIDGSGSIELPPGRWQVLASADGLAVARKTVDVIAGVSQPAPIDFELGSAQIRITAEGIELRNVRFDLDRDVALEQYASVLEEVAATLIADSRILKVEVQGHTDAQGDPVYNYDLSRRRAQSVVQALIDLGVPADLLVSRGYGPSRPIGDNRTSEGRALNRRVDFRTIVAD
ncbi:MAG: OmpA family protein [Alphaproteobacteria bacterium]|nr:OmpA family protein [Alphaproteobacteria bacterium]